MTDERHNSKRNEDHAEHVEKLVQNSVLLGYRSALETYSDRVRTPEANENEPQVRGRG